MKLKIVFALVLLLSCLAFSQNTDKATNGVGTPIFGDEALYRAFQKTSETFRIEAVKTLGTMVVKVDSLRREDTTSIYYFGNNYIDCFITLPDSTSTTDTFYIQRKDTLNPYSSTGWTNQQISFIDISTGNLTPSVTGWLATGSNVIIPGAGLTKTYYINEPRPGTYRVFMSSPSVRSKMKYVKWTGKNR